ncbi:hypothetical protein JAAARDRAFT_204851 [Jaapia argillacea MUCL 33604]|uniref:Uncharacterized protein n=1 Tax=Jaapia argillacea MUCL 33604 TaxID=933084 RepID=A0A067QC62_9AGAM|nr:hypothetical protein JAAARDRAFT_204851 [Jaapia argillacea MUCL 33604]
MPAIRNLNSRRQPPQLIKRPKGQKTFNVMNVLGLSQSEWTALSHRVQALAKRHLNLNVTYPHQDPEARDRFWQEAMEEEPIFSKFENGWPLKYYISERWLSQLVYQAANPRRRPRTRRAKVNVRNDDVEDEEQEELEYLDKGNQEDHLERERTASPSPPPATRRVRFRETPIIDSGGSPSGTRLTLPRNAKTRSLLRHTEDDRKDSSDPPESSIRRQPSATPLSQPRTTISSRNVESRPYPPPVSAPIPTSSPFNYHPTKTKPPTSSRLDRFISSFIKPSASLVNAFEMYGLKSSEDWDQFIHKPKAKRDEVLMKFVFVGLISLFQYQSLMVELEKLSETPFVCK